MNELVRLATALIAAVVILVCLWVIVDLLRQAI